MEEIKTETIQLAEDKTLKVNDLPEEIQGLIRIHDRWKNDEREAQLELHKTSTAIRGLGSEIASKIQDHLNPKPETTDDETQATDAAPETPAQ